MKPLFRLGQLLATRNAVERLNHYQQDLHTYLNRHQQGDWGETLPQEDKEANEQALIEGNRLLSSYHLDQQRSKESRIWIITEADRSVTTILLPEDY
jgi:hypothetical protein